MGRRAIVFIVIGPLFVFLFMRFVVWADAEPGFRPVELMVLPYFYLLSFLPAAIMAGFDQMLADRQVRFRPLVTALIGLVIGMIPAALLMLSTQSLNWGGLGIALMLAGPSLLCSWLSSAFNSPRGNSRPS